MPFIPHTPESLIPRSDSKNPATTCKGITDKGRPCRRALASKTKYGVLAVAPVQTEDGQETDAAAFFCWQHKGQAERLVQRSNDADQNADGTTKLVSLQTRTSLDTLYERLGVLEEEMVNKDSEKRSSQSKTAPYKRPNRPPTWETVEGPIMTVPRKTLPQTQSSTLATRPYSQRKHGKTRHSFLELFFCGVASEDEDYVEVVKHRRRKEQSTNNVKPPAKAGSHSRRRESLPQSRTTAARPANPRLSDVQPGAISKTDTARPIIQHQSSSHTSNLLSVIPQHLTPQTTSQLLTELSKPISSFDEEGYIYMFQLTSPESSGLPSTPSKAAKLLTTEPSPQSRSRRPSTGVRVSSDVSTSSNRLPSGKLLLKIGRASNVQRRMNEWTRQCNYALELVRWYPHLPSSSASTSPNPSPAPSPPFRNSPTTPSHQRLSPKAKKGGRPPDSPFVKKIPHSHRVERLIHIELADKRIRRTCEVCGKEHREWFEIEAGREGVRAVDEVVRRWMEWDEKVAGNSRDDDMN